jgi:hypothetical protein
MTEGIRSNIEVAVFALGLLGGAKRKVATELIAHEAYKLAPDRFSWVLPQYKDYPDKEVVRAALEDAEKPQSGRLVEGKSARDSARDGWILTPPGIRWLEDNQHRIRLALGANEEPRMRLSPTELGRFRSRLRRDPAFQLYSRTGSVAEMSRFMFCDMLQCSPDAPPDLLSFKFDRLLAEAELANDTELNVFLSECQLRFAELFAGRKEEADGQEG